MLIYYNNKEKNMNNFYNELMKSDKDIKHAILELKNNNDKPNDLKKVNYLEKLGFEVVARSYEMKISKFIKDKKVILETRNNSPMKVKATIMLNEDENIIIDMNERKTELVTYSKNIGDNEETKYQYLFIASGLFYADKTLHSGNETNIINQEIYDCIKENVELREQDLFELIDINYDKNIREDKALLSYIRIMKEVKSVLKNENSLKLNKIGIMKNV